MITPKSRLIIALDVTDRKEALDIVAKLGPVVDAVKVNYPLVLSCGLGIIGEIKKYAPVIADFKVADIPNTNRLICEQTFKAGADAIICQGFTGRDSVEACVEVAKKYRRRCLRGHGNEPSRRAGFSAVLCPGAGRSCKFGGRIRHHSAGNPAGAACPDTQEGREHENIVPGRRHTGRRCRGGH